jgi:2-methylcitrate dehydratase PrpD
MQERHPFTAADVEKIIVNGSQVTMDQVGWKYQPQGVTSAQLNLPFCVATLLLEGDCFVEQFSENVIADPARIALADKVEVRHDAEITAKGGKYRHAVRVEAILRDGTRLEEAVEAARGSEKNFASEAQVAGKFEKLALNVLPKSKVDAVRSAVLGLEDCDNCEAIVALMSPEP